jgi:hypothetical protein
VLIFDVIRLLAPVPWLSGRASASHAEGRWFDPSRDHHGRCAGHRHSPKATHSAEIGVDSRPDSELTREEIIARNLKVVDFHFHSETPESVEKAVALYANDITWEAPSRGVVMKDPKQVLQAYRDIFRTLAYRKTLGLRRFATEDFVFDDQVAHA